jgi:hypothetical protein
MNGKACPEWHGKPDAGGACRKKSRDLCETGLDRREGLAKVLGMADHQLEDSTHSPVTAFLGIGPPALQIAGLEQLGPEQGEEASTVKPIGTFQFRGRQFLDVSEEFLKETIPGKTRLLIASGKSRLISVETDSAAPLGKVRAGTADVVLPERTEPIGGIHRAGI